MEEVKTMIYKDRMITMSEAAQNFKVYRLVRLLHALRVIKDDELIRHEEHIWNTKMIAMDIDWYNFRMFGGDETDPLAIPWSVTMYAKDPDFA